MTEIKINISDNMFKDDIADKFADFFERVIADIASGLNNNSTNSCGRYELETAAMLKEAFRTATYKTE